MRMHDKMVGTRLRWLIRAGFSCIVLITLLVAWTTIWWLRNNNASGYRFSLQERLEQIKEQLGRPSSQMALLNARASMYDQSGLHPFVLTNATLDLSNPEHAWDEVDQTQCAVGYAEKGQVCVSITPYRRGGAFVYLVGKYSSTGIVPHVPRSPLENVTRFEVDASLGPQHWRWTVAAQRPASGKPTAASSNRPTAADDRLLLTGYRDGRRLDTAFAGAAWRLDRDAEAFIFRIPVDAWRDLTTAPDAEWPPRTLHSFRVGFRVLGPTNETEFSTEDLPGRPSFSWDGVERALRAGEVLRVQRNDELNGPPALELRQPREFNDSVKEVLDWLVSVPGPTSGQWERSTQVRVRDRLYQLRLVGARDNVDVPMAGVVRMVEVSLPIVLAAIFIFWWTVERRIIARVSRMTELATALSSSLQARGKIPPLFEPLRGLDELGVLAASIDDLTKRANENLHREASRCVGGMEPWSWAARHPSVLIGALDDIARTTQGHELSADIERVKEGLSRMMVPMDRTPHAATGTCDAAAVLASLASRAQAAGLVPLALPNLNRRLQVLADASGLEDVLWKLVVEVHENRMDGSPIQVAVEVNAINIVVEVSSVMKISAETPRRHRTAVAGSSRQEERVRQDSPAVLSPGGGEASGRPASSFIARLLSGNSVHDMERRISRSLTLPRERRFMAGGDAEQHQVPGGDRAAA